MRLNLITNYITNFITNVITILFTHFITNYIKTFSLNNNNTDFFCAYILKDLAQWCDKAKGLSKLVIVKQCVSR